LFVALECVRTSISTNRQIEKMVPGTENRGNAVSSEHRTGRVVVGGGRLNGSRMGEDSDEGPKEHSTAAVPKRVRIAVVTCAIVLLCGGVSFALMQTLRNASHLVEQHDELANIRESNCFIDLKPGENPLIARSKLHHAGFSSPSAPSTSASVTDEALTNNHNDNRKSSGSRAFLISTPPAYEQSAHRKDSELKHTTAGEHNSSSMALMDVLLRASCAKGVWLVDVGANAGWNSLLAASMGCLVCAMEPQTMWTRELARSVCLNGFSTRFVIFHAAAGLNESVGVRYINEDDSTKSHVARSGENGRLQKEEELVDVIRVDSVFEQKRTKQIVALNNVFVHTPRLFQRELALLRVSAGGLGTEADVILGARRLIQRDRVNCVSVLFTSANSARMIDVLSWLVSDHDFRLFHAGPDDHQPRVLVHYKLSIENPANSTGHNNAQVVGIQELAKSMREQQLESEYILAYRGGAPPGVPISKLPPQIVTSDASTTRNSNRKWTLQQISSH